MFSYYYTIVSFLNQLFQLIIMKSIMHLFEELVKDTCGPNCIKILRLLEGKENVSEFNLSEDMDMNINGIKLNSIIS